MGKWTPLLVIWLGGIGFLVAVLLLDSIKGVFRKRPDRRLNS